MPVEHRPPPGLEGLVACAWIGGAGPARILPDGCVDVIWSAGGLVVAGPATRAVDARRAEGEVRLGVRFRVGAAGAALGLPAVELRDRTVPLADVWGRAVADRLRGDVARVAERPAAARPGAEELALGALLEGVARRLPAAGDPLVRGAVLAAARGVEDLGAEVALGERQLRRRFLDAVGYGPRTLRRVLRLQRFLALAAHDRDATLARLAADAGYADQAHLARDCRELAGAPPSALRGDGAREAGERALVSDPSKARAAMSPTLHA